MRPKALFKIPTGQHPAGISQDGRRRGVVGAIAVEGSGPAEEPGASQCILEKECF